VADPDRELTLIAQITDSHVGASPDDAASAKALAAAVDAVRALDPAPAAVLFTGDLVKDGTPEEYALVRELIAPLAMPVHPIPGNHDIRDAFREAFSGHTGIEAAGERLDYAVDCGPARVVCLDTAVTGQAAGRLGPGRVEWIRAELEAAEDRPVIVAMHHAPVGVGLHEFDHIGLAAEDRDALRSLFERGPRPELIVAGHLHRAVTAQVGGVPVFVCPSVHLQVKLDFGPLDKLRMTDEPPGFGVILHGADPRLVAHVQPI